MSKTGSLKVGEEVELRDGRTGMVRRSMPDNMVEVQVGPLRVVVHSANVWREGEKASEKME